MKKVNSKESVVRSPGFSLLTPYFLLLTVLAGCSSIPAEFFSKDKAFSISGLYAVHPTYGLTGIGYMSYESKSVDEQKLAAIKEQLETLEAVIAYLARKEVERQESRTELKGLRAETRPVVLGPQP